MLIMQICIPKVRRGIFKDIRKDGEFGAKTCTSVGVKRGKGKHVFIEHYVDPPFFWIKALKAFVHVTIPEKNALFRSKLKFLGIIGPKIWPYGTSKGVKEAIVRLATKQMLNFRLESVYKKHNNRKRFIPKLQGHGGMGEECKPHLNNMSVLTLC
jgi:hypothetical protein